MTVTIRRRELLAALGSAAVAWPLSARAQQSGMPVIGFLNGASPEAYALYAAQGPFQARYWYWRKELRLAVQQLPLPPERP